jgi:hypothetical protein
MVRGKRKTYGWPPGLFLLAGCAAGAGQDGRAWESGRASLELRPAVSEGRFQTQGIVSPYTASSINHLQVKLFKLVGGNEQAVQLPGGQNLEADLPQASLSSKVVFTNLTYDTTYRARGYAYGDAGTANLISTQDNRSRVDITIGRDDRPNLATLPIQLIDKPFSGEASPAIQVTTGGLVPTGTASIALAPKLGTFSATYPGGAAVPVIEDAVSSMAIVRAGDFLYGFGGYNSTLNNAVFRTRKATINSDGTITALDKILVDMQTGVSAPRAIKLGNTMYVIGGRLAGGASLRKIDKAAMNPDGTFADTDFTPVTEEFKLVTGRSEFQILRVGDFLYAIGGMDQQGGVGLPSVERAAIGADGSLGTWSTVAGVTLQSARGGMGAAVIGDYYYVFGGFGTSVLSSVERASVNSQTGALGNFETVQATALSPGVSGPQAFVGGGFVYLIGGHIQNGTYQTTVQRAKIAVDGSLETFSTYTASTLPNARGFQGIFANGDKVHLFGGWNGSSGTTAIWVAEFK